MKLRQLTTSLCLFLLCLLLWSCEQPKATVTDLTKPLSDSPTPSVTPPPTVDPRRTDLNRVVVGTAAPDFSLEDMNKKMVHLSDFKGKKFVVLVFYRGFF
ncbi:MAG: redoxin domain-containing protein [Acidobacteria bacterium]|nr:redoxin domain-containing protein [Acidobacteriota bacterium]